MKPSLIVHGGAWSIPDEFVEECRAGCRSALAAGWEILVRGGAAIDAVEAAIVALENDPIF
ncbi:MAG: peptidase T, partial [Acidobacteria bacterium]